MARKSSNSRQEPQRRVKLPRQRLCSFATAIYNVHDSPRPATIPANPITVVCISDTHTTKPSLPPGDLLLHAGDLSEIGSFGEIQAQLTWLSSQPHKHKVMIAGNHDVLFDRPFLDAHPEYNTTGGMSASDLDFGDVIYLCDEATTLQFPHHGSKGREITIYGSPTTPQYGASAFQVPRTEDVWWRKVPKGTEILLTHGPPWSHLDGDLHSGSVSMAKEIARVRPRLVVFGHIHVGYGQEEIKFDKVRGAYEGIIGGWEGHIALLGMAFRVARAKVTSKLHQACSCVVGTQNRFDSTMLVNAAVVGGEAHQYSNMPIVVHI